MENSSLSLSDSLWIEKESCNILAYKRQTLIFLGSNIIYVQANFVIKTLNSTNGSTYLTEKIRESLFVMRRQPRIGKFFNNARGKIRKQSIQNRFKFMEVVKTDWLGIDMDDSARRQLLKKSFFKYFSWTRWHDCPWFSIVLTVFISFIIH